jgi:hypothetical protein
MNWDAFINNYLNNYDFDEAFNKIMADSGLSEDFTLPDGTVLMNVHSRKRCSLRPCIIHNPSQHSMSDFPLHWRDDRRMFERICPHGIGHPDPDDVLFHLTLANGDDGYAVHGCDGCCRKIGEEQR